MRISAYRVAALQGPPGVDASFVDLGPAGQLGVGAAWARVAPGHRSLPNQHDEIETWVIVAGTGVVFADAERRPVSASIVVQFEPFETHFVENTGATDLVFASFYWRDGDRAMWVATGVEHRRFHERPTFVLSSGPLFAAAVFVRYQRMTGASAWHISTGEQTGADAGHAAGLRAFRSRLPAHAPPLPELRAGVEAHHRLGRVPAAVRAVAARAFDGEPFDADPWIEANAGPAFDVLYGIEALGRDLRQDWRAEAPQGDWKIVRFLDPDAVFSAAILQPALYRLAHPDWTPDVDYHVSEPAAPDGGELDAWQAWLDDLGARVEARYGGIAPDSGIWTPDQTAFLARLESRLAAMTVSLGPDGFSPGAAAETLSGIVEDVTSFARLQSPLMEIEVWKDEARTAVALELAAALLLATCAAPLMPEFAARLAAALGGPVPAGWPHRVALVKPGSRIHLAGAVLFGEPEESPLLPWLSNLVRGVMRLPDDEPVRDMTPAALGMESLQAIALQYQILDQVGADVSIEDLLGRRDVAELATFIASGLAPEVVTAHAGARP